MTATVLLDHVSTYAARVRDHLADLAPEQVEDLTDGLEADLAEALEDAAGPSVADGLPCADGGTERLDLASRFGRPEAYAAELRAAAGLGAAAARRTRRPVRAAVRGLVTDAWEGLVAWTAPWRGSTVGRGVIDLAVALRPLWWVVRGWVWFVLALGVLSPFEESLDRYVPDTFGAWVLLLVGLGLSVAVGRGAGRRVMLARRGLAALSVLAVLATPWAVQSFTAELRWRVSTGSYPVFIENEVVTQVVPQEGVFVDGQQVSNLFVYDAAGNPLSDVQIVDDRGRQVRTVADSRSEWSLPGVDEAWSFLPRVDGDGRTRWNVYPLLGAPASQWTTGADGARGLLDGVLAHTPPAPFAQAPALPAQVLPSTADAVEPTAEGVGPSAEEVTAP